MGEKIKKIIITCGMHSSILIAGSTATLNHIKDKDIIEYFGNVGVCLLLQNNESQS